MKMYVLLYRHLTIEKTIAQQVDEYLVISLLFLLDSSQQISKQPIGRFTECNRYNKASNN